MNTVPHFNGFALDPIKVAEPATQTAAQKRTKAKKQMKDAGYSN
jgi:hypothetical protein